jgi:hypothetical protein
VIPKKMTSLIAGIVSKIGESKDDSEMQIYFREAMGKLGMPATKVTTVMNTLDKVLNTQIIDHQNMARGIQAQLTDTKLLKKFVEAIKKLN